MHIIRPGEDTVVETAVADPQAVGDRGCAVRDRGPCRLGGVG